MKIMRKIFLFSVAALITMSFAGCGREEYADELDVDEIIYYLDLYDYGWVEEEDVKIEEKISEVDF